MNIKLPSSYTKQHFPQSSAPPLCRADCWHIIANATRRFLKSYVGMGSATIACRGGCSCDSVAVSARTTERVSMTNYQHVHITTANASGAVAPCDLVFDRVPDADGTIGKWKLSNFVLLKNLPREVVEHTIAQQADEPVQ